MKKKSYSLYTLAAVAAFSLSSCQLPSDVMNPWPEDDWNGPVNANETPHQPPNLYGTPTSPKTNTNTSTNTKPTSTSTVTVPPSYYLAKGQPVSHQTSDSAWVNKQDATGYTVQLASNSSAPAVASTLQTAPKDARLAQIQYDANGQPTYIGVYGTYPTQQAAQAALAQLPKNLQSSASVQSWSNIQDKIQSSPPASSDTSSIAPPDVTDTSATTSATNTQ